MDWDERRRLARDIATLTAPDLQGVLLRCNLAAPSANSIEPKTQAEDHGTSKRSNWQMTTCVDLDSFDQSVLLELRAYVDSCYRTRKPPLEQCDICCGLWSIGRVITCGNQMCSTKIHEECFGSVLREDANGPWFCPSCLNGTPLQCCLCLREGGALKPTSDRRWAHVICALAIPELSFRDVPTMEPIDGIIDLDPFRFRTLCNICKRKGGAVVLCEEPNCGTAFHVFCAAEAGLWIGKAAAGGEPANPMALFCDKHLPQDRIVGAKRYVSEEDLAIETIEASNPIAEIPSSDDYNFVCNSATFLLAMQKWNIRVVTPNLPPSSSSLFDVTPRLYHQNRFPVKPLVSEMVAKFVDVEDNNTIPVFPIKRTARKHKLPDGPKLVGGIVEVFWKGYDEWNRAKVIEWCPTRQMNLLRYLSDDREEWLRLVHGQCHVLRLSSDNPKLIKLMRYKYKSSREWRPKVKDF
ncbi:hypothetical protein THRCLA_08275 [Thraustotheca clavata]|uniref:PHD-type domain-containing protein n=1 Tax=Thraustotheca clavata TaxID=74557 RepID=A0A1V9Z7U7_9STRA|nr:hypothetical protein THRCLA_08275 [Thraustotheca clavata]